MKRGLALLALAVLAGACQGADERRVVYPEDLEVAFTLVFEDGVLVSQQGPLVGAAASLELATDQELVLIGWRAEELRDVTPRLDASRLGQSELEAESETCTEVGRLSSNADLERWPVPSSSRVWVLEPNGVELEPDPRGAAMLSDWSLSLPIGNNDCGVPWPEPIRQLSVPGVLGRFGSRIERIDEDRVVLAGSAQLSLLTRDQTWASSPATSLLASEVHPTFEFHNLAHGADRIFVTMVEQKDSPDPELADGFVVELALDESGLGGWTRSESTTMEWGDIAVDPRGRIVVAGGRYVLTGTAATALTRVDRGSAPSAHVVATREGLAPHILAGDAGWLAEGDVAADPSGLEVDEVFQEIAVTRTREIVVGPREGEIWSWVGMDSTLHRRDGEWEELDAFLPPGMDDCGSVAPECGRRKMGKRFGVIPSTPPLAYGWDCGAVFVIDEDLECLRPVELEGDIPEFTYTRRDAFDLNEDWVTFGTREGVILELRR